MRIQSDGCAPCYYSMVRGYAEAAPTLTLLSLIKDLRTLQETQFREVQQIFTQALGDLSRSRFCIATTGSDARAEKASRQSPVDLILIEGPENAAASPQVEKASVDSAGSGSASGPSLLSSTPPPFAVKVTTVIRGFPRIFDPVIHVHQLAGKTNPLAIASPTKKPGQVMHMVIPPRALEARLLYGNSQIMGQFQESARTSFLALNSSQRRNFIRNFYIEAQNALEACFCKKAKLPVDLQTGTLFYDGQRMKSVKHVLLRPVQFKLCALQMQSRQSYAEVVFQMPKTISTRILWLQARGILPLTLEKAKKLSADYEQALLWYLESQEAFAISGTTSTQVDPKRLGEVATTIYEFFNWIAPEAASEKPTAAAKK